MNKKITFFFILLTWLIPLFNPIKAQVVIPMEEEAGVFKIPCKVNGLKLKFIFDTGASNVCISSAVANMMLENDYLSKDDIKGTGESQIADGNIIEHTKIILKKLEIGDLLLRNVEAVVIHQQTAPLLLGQSAIQKLGTVSIVGNQLHIKTRNYPKSINKSLSYEELSQLFREALDLYGDLKFSAAAEIFDTLYENNFLEPRDLKLYAYCLGRVERREEALEIYLSVENWFKSNDKSELASLYSSIAKEAYFTNEYDICKKYIELTKYHSDILSSYYEDVIGYSALLYKSLDNCFMSIQVLKGFIKDYMSYMEIVPTDCWNKGYIDPLIADKYYQIGIYSEDLEDSKKYMIIAAAWGHKEAQEMCNKFNLSYYFQPYEYVY